MENDQFIQRAQQVSREFQEQIDRVKGKQIRVLRAVVYEGEGEAVLRCLASSLPVGTKVVPNRGSPYTITVSQDKIVTLPEPARIHVADLDPSTLVGIAPCDDGEDGWVVMAVQPDPDAPSMEIVAPVGDEHGQIVYMNILDAAEVLKTGKVWRHDMGEDDEATDDPDSGPLEATDDPDSEPLDTAPSTAT